ncbi:MAG: hypothetical protein HS126_24640 [Anaerolineales bacterium]|nr:hypothetical protein [Anaerolineales bacterium]
MAIQSDNLSTWQITNGWREIFARIFAEFETKLNVSPEWLVNPATNRRLKLDLLYPQIGVAVRFEGAEIKQRRRLSLEEEAQQRVRDDARVEVCQAHGIDLILVDLSLETPRLIFQDIDQKLSRASQHLKAAELRSKISQARATAATLARQAPSYSNFKLYADLWEDRQYQVVAPASASAAPQAKPTVSFRVGMEVEHTSYGPGFVVAATPSDDDILVTVDFITAGQKTFAASLVADKLYPR